MRPARRSKLTALLIAPIFLLSTFARAQDATPSHQTRPRRVSAPAPVPTPATTNRPSPAPAATAAPVVTAAPAVVVTRLTEEPTVRVGLTTSARSVIISTSGQLLGASGWEARPAPLQVARVRLEARALSPLPAPRATPVPDSDDDSAVELAGGPTPRERSSAVSPSASSAPSAATVRAPNANRPAANSAAGGTRGGGGNVRLVSRAMSFPTREVAVFATGAQPFMRASEPVTFASDDEQQRPLQFAGKTYRGRLEVFANPRGTLTVVNVVGLEDYVRGVVPNELSPGSYGALEALKAQAVAARTYALSNRGRFAAEGFDVLPTTRSQVYGGLSTEHPLTTRAVAETRGIVATYQGEPIEALYTSTCGGRTEHAENIFGNDAAPYLRARECSIEGNNPFAPFTIRTSREPLILQAAEHAASARAVALLAVYGFRLPARVTDDWLAAPLATDEARALLERVAQLARRAPPTVPPEATRAPAFISALARAADGESRADVLLDDADISYLLAFRDADEIPAPHRADVALFLREGLLTLHPDATLRPRQAITRARALQTVARLLEARNLITLQRATARPSENGALVLRPATSARGPDRTLAVNADAYLFRAFGEALFPVREVTVIGGEPVAFRTDARGQVDYMEVRPAPDGAASDRFSPFTNWTATMTPAQAQARLARYARNVGAVVDLRVSARGASRRALVLEIVGTNGTAQVRGGRIRSALGLREQLFVIDRQYDEAGRLISFRFTGRGWGHGVGMCQVGAYGLARAGWTYDRILRAYYTGIELSRLY